MTRQGRHSAPSLLHTAEEARSGPRRGVAGSVPGWALPHYGTLGWHLSHHLGTSALLACVGFGARAASKAATVASSQRGAATHQWMKTDLKTDGFGITLKHSAIAICIAHVLNSTGAPIASLTSKLTRHERGPNRGPNGRRVCTETRCGTSDGGERASASGVSRHGHSRWQVVSTAKRIADSTSTPIAARGPRAQPCTTLASGCCGADRAELCGLAPSCRAPLS
jgi:hypothetical protein